MTAESGEGPVERISRLAFYVFGTVRPQGSKKAFVVPGQNGKPTARIVNANDDVLKEWRASVVYAAREALAGRDGFERQTPVAVFTTFYFRRPTTVRRLFPTVPPDVEKCARAVNDAMTIAGVYGDDSQIVQSHSEKKYADRDHPAGAEVLVVELA